MRTSSFVLNVTSALTLLVATVSLGGCKGKSNQLVAVPSAAPSAPPGPPPFGVDERDVLTALVRTTSCAPSSCGPIDCRRVSDGVTNGYPSHVAECRWTDERTPATRDRCAYAHFSYEAASNRFGELSLSTVSLSQTCQADPAFNAQLKELGYTGTPP